MTRSLTILFALAACTSDPPDTDEPTAATPDTGTASDPDDTDIPEETGATGDTGTVDDRLPPVRGPFTMPDSIVDICTDGESNVDCAYASTEAGQDGHVRIAVPEPVELDDGIVFDDVTRLA